MSVGEVKLSKIEPNRDGLTPARMLQVVITDDDDVQDVEHYQPAGEDSNPPAGTKVFIVESGRSWKIAIAGNDGTAPAPDLLLGEKEIYASSGGVRVCRIRFKADGSIEMRGVTEQTGILMNPDASIRVENGLGFYEIGPDGQFNANDNFTVDP